MRAPNKVFEEGFDAYFAGIDRQNNPYPKDSDDYSSWNEGWDSAKESDQ